VLAAHEAGIPVQARTNEFGDPLPGSRVDSLTTPKGGVPSTWGEGVTNRIGNRNAPYHFHSWLRKAVEDFIEFGAMEFG